MRKGSWAALSFFSAETRMPKPGLAAGQRLEALAVAALQRLPVRTALGTGARVQEEECHRYRHDDRTD
jgi:hypothetical protein